LIENGDNNKMLEELKSKLKELAELRRDIKNQEEYIAERKAEYEATPAYQSYKKATEAKADLTKQADEVKRVCINIGQLASAQTNWENRKPVSGVEVKRFSTFVLKDETAAKDWATKNKPSVLTLDMTELKKAVKELELPWFAIEDDYRAQIDSDLSQYLDE